MKEKNEVVVYEVRGFVEGYDEPMNAFFETQDMAELWLSDFYYGEIHRMVIEERPEINYEEIARYLDSLETGE